MSRGEDEEPKSQKISSNAVLNFNSVLVCGDCAELPEGPSLPGSGSAIFDRSLFQSGKLVSVRVEPPLPFEDSVLISAGDRANKERASGGGAKS